MKPMTIIGWIAAFAVGAALSVIVLLQAMPDILMSAAMERVGDRGLGFNEWTTPQFPDASVREVVMPSPDIGYSVCLYNLKDGPLRVHAEAIDGLAYWSLSGFDHRTVNFFTVNDIDTAGKSGDVVLATGAVEKKMCGLPVVKSETRTGIMLIRRLAPTPDAMERVNNMELLDVCAPIDPETCEIR